MTIAPAARSRATTGASATGAAPRGTREAAVVGVPARSMMSLTDTGTPCRGPRYRPVAISRAAASASARAASSSTTVKALRASSQARMRSRAASTTSRTVASPARIAAESRCSGWSHHDVVTALPGCWMGEPAGPPPGSRTRRAVGGLLRQAPRDAGPTRAAAVAWRPRRRSEATRRRSSREPVVSVPARGGRCRATGHRTPTGTRRRFAPGTRPRASAATEGRSLPRRTRTFRRRVIGA